jgi:hypothetical protein
MKDFFINLIVLSSQWFFLNLTNNQRLTLTLKLHHEGIFVAKNVFKNTVFLNNTTTVKPLFNGHPWDLKPWSLCRVFFRKRSVVCESEDGRWAFSCPLSIGGHCSEVVVLTSLTVYYNIIYFNLTSQYYKLMKSVCFLLLIILIVMSAFHNKNKNTYLSGFLSTNSMCE